MNESRQIVIFCLVGFVFVGFFGTLSHFFYSWSGKNKFVGILFPAYESTWEHLKLAIFPTLVYFLIGMIFLNNSNYLFAFFCTLLIPMILIPTIFYSYTSITKSPILIVDILTYYFALFVAFLMCFNILNYAPLGNVLNIISILGIIVIIILYLTFTLKPPKKFLFKDPITGGYGLID